MPLAAVDNWSNMADKMTMTIQSENVDIAQSAGGEPQPLLRMALTALAISVGVLLAGAIWLAIERAPALLLDLAKMPWCS